MIDINKKYKTRDGRKVRILATDINDKKYPVVAIIENNEKDEIDSFTISGEYFADKSYSDSDLIEVKEKQVRWLNIYPSFANIHETKERADECAGNYRIACIKVEYEEGEGLE